MSTPQVCIVFNPTAGRGRAARLRDLFQREFPAGFDLCPTTGPGHAEELACAAARAGCPMVVAAGGDGTVHEVANGILRSGNPNTLFRILPIGSANDYAYSLEWEEKQGQAKNAEHEEVRLPGNDARFRVRQVDVGLARRPDGKTRYFVNGLGLGFNGTVTMESRRIRWLRGLPLYGLALLRAMWYHFEAPPMAIRFDDDLRETPTLALTVNLGRREGNFIMAPDAILDDGYFDYLHAGPLSRWTLLRQVPGMITGNLPRDHPQIRLGRCKEVQVRAQTPLVVHLDGEFFCLPGDGVCEVEAKLLPKALKVAVG